MAYAAAGGSDGAAAPDQAAAAEHAAEGAGSNAVTACTNMATEVSDAEASCTDTDGSSESEGERELEDVDEWLYCMLQQSWPGCQITIHALQMLGDFFDTVRNFLGRDKNASRIQLHALELQGNNRDVNKHVCNNTR